MQLVQNGGAQDGHGTAEGREGVERVRSDFCGDSHAQAKTLELFKQGDDQDRSEQGRPNKDVSAAPYSIL